MSVARLLWQDGRSYWSEPGVDAARGHLQPLGFGDYEVDRVTRQLRKQGRRIRLQDQPFQVLCMLLERAGGVVTREELHQTLWPGSVYVDFDHGLNNAIARLREALRDNAAAPTYIETLPRVGYRFIYPLAVPPVDSAPPPRRRPGPWAIGAAAIVLAALLWTGLRDRPEAPDESPDAAVASIAIVPFASLSGDAEDARFADGLSEELMAQLSRIHTLRVAGAGSSFRFREGKETAAEIAGSLGVDHLLQGSVRRSGQRVRVTTRLVDARTDRQLWSQTFERDLGDIFAIEDEITRAVTAALQVRVIEAEARQLAVQGTHDAEAYRLYLMGMAQLRGRGVNPDREGARRLFEQAIVIDPEFAAAHAGLASYHFNNINSRMVNGEVSWQVGIAAAERAYALEPGSGDAMRVMADFEMLRYRFQGESDAYRRATTLFERAVAAEPANAYAHFDFGRAVQWTDAGRALELFERADQLDPLVPVADGLALLALDRLGMKDAAAGRLERFLEHAGESYGARVVAAFASGRGDLDAAAAALTGIGPPFAADIGQVLLLAGIYRSLGDGAEAADVLRRGGADPLMDTLARAALLSAGGDHDAAFRELDRRRDEYRATRMLDLPAARLALLAGEYGRAAAILERRLPDLANGSDAINPMRVLPAMDLVLAWSRTGRVDSSRRLLERVEAYLDGPGAPQLPMFMVLRARAHALAGRAKEARDALERARAAGFRLTCHLDLQPQPLLYVDCMDADPAFAALQRDGSFGRWLAAIRIDNLASRDRLRSRLASKPAA